MFLRLSICLAVFLFVPFFTQEAQAQGCCNTCACSLEPSGYLRLCTDSCDWCGCFSWCCEHCTQCTYCPSCPQAPEGENLTHLVSGELQDVSLAEAVQFLIAGRGLRMEVLGNPAARVSIAFHERSLLSVLLELETSAGATILLDSGPITDPERLPVLGPPPPCSAPASRIVKGAG